MTPEQEAKNLERDIAYAQATGDIATILSLMAKTTALTPQDYIKKTVGSIKYVYYIYVKYFHLKPQDLEDMVDGLLFINAQQYQEKLAYDEAQSKLRKHNG